MTTAPRSSKLFLRLLNGENPQQRPVWLMRQAGRYLPEYRAVRATANGFLDLCYSPDKACEVTLQPLRRYNFDAAILFSDILVIPHALGQNVTFKEGDGPILTPVRDEEGLKALSLDTVLKNLDPCLQTVSKLSATLPDTTALIGFAGAPWTVATYVVEGRGSKDYQHTKMMAYGNPVLFQKIIELLTEATILYLDAQIRNRAETVQIFDSWAGVLPPDQFRKWVIAPTKTIVERLKARHPHVPIIGFPKGASVLLEAYVKETGVDAVSLDSSIPLDWAVRTLENVALQGNLDPLMLAAGGKAMDEAIDRILDQTRSARLIFNLGHGILPFTPPEHVSRLMEKVKNWTR